MKIIIKMLTTTSIIKITSRFYKHNVSRKKPECIKKPYLQHHFFAEKIYFTG